ncbi:hypothetical protein BCR35DRAFT_299050 [Leucosporidium creatinivorum]|uniref:Uncharacterized protein n=1 Tax=Leucosporidium creatinivorum TaxID=106004 RepID=A0A1Y2G6W5_9BASI|nr:hypothetical protein BCR35DRAFT_299050 [Leucosporidium creatinivorum]
MDLRRFMAHRDRGGIPGGAGESTGVPAARRLPVARASLLRGGPSDARRKENALVKIQEAAKIIKAVEASPVTFERETWERSIRPHYEQARRLFQELRGVPASDNFKESDPRFAELTQAANAAMQSITEALAAGRAARIEFIESKLTEASTELEEVEGFDADSQDPETQALCDRSASLHDDIEDLIMGSSHSSDEELVEEANDAAKLQAEGHVLAMQMNRHHQHLAAAARRFADRKPLGSRRSASPPRIRRNSDSGPSHSDRRGRRENSLSKGRAAHQHIPQLSQRQAYLHGVSERALLGRYGYSRTADGRRPSTQC